MTDEIKIELAYDPKKGLIDWINELVSTKRKDAYVRQPGAGTFRACVREDIQRELNDQRQGKIDPSCVKDSRQVARFEQRKAAKRNMSIARREAMYTRKAEHAEAKNARIKLKLNLKPTIEEEAEAGAE